MATAEEYVAAARSRVLELLRQHHAMVHPEVEARVAETLSDYNNIDPHHLTTALRELHAEGVIATQAAKTRGGHLVSTMTLADLGKRVTVTEAAARRKRLLMARYAGWSQGTKRDPHGLIGPAGETAVRSAILEAESVIPAAPRAGEVGHLLGTKLPGKVDSAGYMLPITKGLPGSAVTVLVEMKNLRSWIYPASSELYQLLNKGVVLPQANPARPIVPVLACRRAHKTTF